MTDQVISLSGELTIQTAAEVLASVRPRLGMDAAVDLSEVSEMDTAGLQILLLMKREAEARRRCLELLSPSDAVTEVIRIAGLGTDLEVEQ